MFFFLGSLSVFIAIALIFVVVIQNSKGGGLSSTFGSGGASQIMGARRSNEFIEKITWYMALGLALIAFAANVFGGSGTVTSNELRMSGAIEDQIISNPVSLPDANTLPEAPGTPSTEPAE